MKNPNVFKCKGKVVKVEEPQIHSEHCASQQVVLMVGGKFPKTVAFSLFNEKVEWSEQIVVGEIISFTFAPQSTCWKDKWYTNLHIVAITNSGATRETAKPRKAIQPQVNFYEASDSDKPRIGYKPKQ